MEKNVNVKIHNTDMLKNIFGTGKNIDINIEISDGYFDSSSEDILIMSVIPFKNKYIGASVFLDCDFDTEIVNLIKGVIQECQYSLSSSGFSYIAMTVPIILLKKIVSSIIKEMESYNYTVKVKNINIFIIDEITKDEIQSITYEKFLELEDYKCLINYFYEGNLT